ncbi:transcriptional regulator PhoU [Blautia hydrogenotrophica]|uniref:Na/Pi cotransporter family protein n=1 Tax=Blautia hydrogenotrophica TaxID=53443 RepID=UPI0006C6B4E9|nr:Na/Pi cotransporter family protein [Blautia hydrogenotrophica]CUM99329.1 transcriptional regulator PhoU [Blautia hydrogenotrophica]SCH86480.1 transcriptional regulator PhoU [uncultured Blautia sp.]
MEILLGLMGGLGLFLFGMKLMSDGLEKAAGAKMRSILEFFTKNTIRGILVGTFFTAVIQSSSAATVMTVSFVNSGLMNLYQAAGVIMGANIGTTVTSQLISFNLSALAPLFVIAGVVMYMFCKRQKIQNIGMVILGFGVLFMGMTTMSSSMSTLKTDPVVLETMSSLTNHYLAILVGIVVTAVLQSSSATVGIVLLLANQGLLDIRICFFIILGCNIGSCVSAMLASLNGKRDAKRTALIHLLFNIIGTIIVFLVLTVALEPITAFIQNISGHNPGREVANAHTLIKITEVIILAPFVKQIVHLTHYILPEKKHKNAQPKEDNYGLQFIGAKSILSPATAVFDATRELEHMGNMAVTNLQRAMNSLITLDEDEIQEVCKVEKNIDYLNHAITDYLVKLNQTTLPVDDAKSIGGLFHVANDIERIGDHAENVAEAAAMRKSQNIVFSPQAQKEMGEMLDLVIKVTAYALDMFSNNNQEHMQEILDLENQVDEMERMFQENHVQRLTRNECTPSAGMIFSDIISGLERVSDHATNIAFSLLEKDPVEMQKNATAAG